MTRHPKPGCIICRDGTGLRVESRDGALVVTRPCPDGLRASSGLGVRIGRRRNRVGNPARGVPVDVVRAYVRLHHGVAAIHPTALAIPPRRAAPGPSSISGGEEAAPQRPFPPPVAAAAPPRSLPGPGRVLDDLTQAVIAARRLAAEARGPFLEKGKPVEGVDRRPAPRPPDVVVRRRRVAPRARDAAPLRGSPPARRSDRPPRGAPGQVRAAPRRAQDPAGQGDPDLLHHDTPSCVNFAPGIPSW